MQPLAKLIVTGLGTYSVLEPCDNHIPWARFAQSNDWQPCTKEFSSKNASFVHYIIATRAKQGLNLGSNTLHHLASNDV